MVGANQHPQHMRYNQPDKADIAALTLGLLTAAEGVSY
jgi:hypothetical protein